jgi:methylmalonyl-CoA mutase
MLNPKPDQFKKLTKEEWLEKIQSDLKDQSPEALAWEIEPGITADPFPHRDDMRDHPFIPFDEKPYTWEIAEQFDVLNARKANDGILTALEGGVQTIVLRKLPENGHVEYPLLFKDVRPNFIRTIIAVDNVKEYSRAISLISWLSEKFEKSEEINIDLLIEDPNILENAFSPQDFPSNTGPRFVFSIPESAEQHLFVETASGYFAGMAALLDQKDIDPKDVLLRSGFKYRVGSLFFVEIARLKALRILWRNFTLALTGKAGEPFILAGFRNDILNKNAEFNMIRAATMTLSAVLGRADAIAVKPSGQTGNPEHDRRIARNVHHILMQESHLNDYKDAAEGSYYLESLTQAYATTCWEAIQKKLAGQIGESGIIHES